MDISAEIRNNFELLSRFVNELGSKSCKKIQKENYNQESALVPSQAIFIACEGYEGRTFHCLRGCTREKKKTLRIKYQKQSVHKRYQTTKEVAVHSGCEK